MGQLKGEEEVTTPNSERYIQRGKPTYGVDLGIMLLDADFPRPVGDIANGKTFSFPVHYEVTRGASVPHVVEKSAEGLLAKFVESGKALIHRGVRGLATSCGFLSIFQRELSEELQVPVLTSSLLQIPLALRVIPPSSSLCVLTVNGSTLTAAHLEGAGISVADQERIVVVGLEKGHHFYPVVVGDEGPLDPERAEEEILAACLAALKGERKIGGFVFECTNLPPYSERVRLETKLPVWDAITAANWLQGALSHPFQKWV